MLSFVLVLVFTSGVLATLPNCTVVDTGCSNVANSNCTAPGHPCECNRGFHEKNDSTGCEADILPGGACRFLNSSQECVDNAICRGSSADLLNCTCNVNFHVMNTSGVLSCQRDVELGGVCTLLDSDLECVDLAICAKVSDTEMNCKCIPQYHFVDSAGNFSCVSDVLPGGPCTIVDTNLECTQNATCRNITNAGSVGLNCTCDPGYHTMNVSQGGFSCQPDVPPGGACMYMNDPYECVGNATCRNTRTEVAAAETLNCTCDVNYHAALANNVTGVLACFPDVPPGGSCKTVNSSEECGIGGICRDVATEGASQQLNCTCKNGYNVTTILPGVQSCQPDRLPPGSACTQVNNASECVEGAMCLNATAEGAIASLQCMCTENYHVTGDTGNLSCEQDILPGSSCSKVNTSTECVEHATCLSTQSAQTSPLPKCTCDDGFHSMNTSGTANCKPDLSPGSQCTMENSSHECSPHAECRQTLAIGGTVVLNCTCNPRYHAAPAPNHTLPFVCVADNCSDSLKKCSDSGLNNCTLANAYVSCVLASVCTLNNSNDVTQINLALTIARLHIPQDCDFSSTNTCSGMLTKCFNSFLKQNISCSTVAELNNCAVSANCSDAGSQERAVALVYSTEVSRALSCDCIRALDVCESNHAYNFTQAANDTDKCRAVQDLFHCALSSPCNSSFATDTTRLSRVWALAMTNAQTSSCVVEAETSSSCQLQLTTCTLKYAEGLKNAGDDKTRNCIAVTQFEKCLNTNTTQCLDTDRSSFRLQQQSAITAFDCECIRRLEICDDNLTQVYEDVTMKCRQVSEYILCLLTSQCGLQDVADSSRLTSAIRNANSVKLNRNCLMTPGQSCTDNLSACSDEFNTNFVADGISSERKCSVASDLLLCVNAGKCSYETAPENQTLANARDSAVLRLQSLNCGITCEGSYSSLLACQTTYDLSVAHNDTTLKCEAQNKYVSCLNALVCNGRLVDDIKAKYKALQESKVQDCSLLALSGTGNANMLRMSVLTLICVLSFALHKYVCEEY